MRKIIFISMVALFAIVNTVNAQFLRFGFKAGVTSSNMKFDKTTLDNITTTSGLNSFVVDWVYYGEFCL